MKTILRFILRLCYGFTAENTGALQEKGPVLLVPNHVSWLDWLFLYVVLENDWKFVASRTTAQTSWFHRAAMINRRTFPVDTASPYAVRELADYLERGGRLVLFAEGRISNTGSLMKLFEGTGFLIRKTNTKIITCYLRGANRLPWVRHAGWTHWFPRVTAHFSDTLLVPAFNELSHTAARQKLTTWLRDQMVKQQFQVEHTTGAPSVLSAIGQTAAAIPNRIALEDVTFKPMTFRRLMVSVDALTSAWPKQSSAAPAERVGVLLPNVSAVPVVLLSLWARGKIPALLNFSTGMPTLLQCIRLAGVRRIVTSRTFVEKARLDLSTLIAAGVEITYLEEIGRAVSRWRKLVAFAGHAFTPGSKFRRSNLKSSDTAVILFTSGSEGTPKGVELTHGNLLANIRQASVVVDLRDDDRFFNALPLFHSFGLTGGTLFPLVRGCYTFLYPSPLHYRIVPNMVYDRQCTVLMGTNTFLNGYARKAHAYDFTSLRYLMAGAEKVQGATFETWARKFGVRILEGYGATECSPIISLNTRMEPGVGTAGRLLPGMEARLEEVAGVTDGGRLLVRGPNVMKGYLNPDANARFQSLEGWYDTGDIVFLDTDGFVHIRGRLKRFAKVSGEMVSLTAVEDALAGEFKHLGLRSEVVIIARPDADRGETLIAVTNEPRIELADLRVVIRSKGLSNISAPREIKLVRSIPKLGTGKTNHRELERSLSSDVSPVAA